MTVRRKRADVRTLVTGDIHLSPNPRDAYRIRWMQKLPILLNAHRASRLILLGDLTEYKDEHPAGLVNEMADLICAVAEVAEVIILKGNHDYLNAEVPFFRFLGELPGVRWINAPIRLTLDGLGECLFLPHERRPTEAWASVDLRHADWIFCHQTFSGARSEHGRKLDGVGTDIFPRGSRVVSGDVHAPQQVGPVRYAGAPYTIDHGDQYEPQVLILSGRDVAVVQSEGARKVLMTISGADPLAALSMKHPFKGAGLPAVCAGDVVKLRVNLPPDGRQTPAEIRRAVDEWATREGVELAAVQISGIAPRRSLAATAEKLAATDDAALVRAYAKKMGQGKSTISAGLKIIEKVG